MNALTNSRKIRNVYSNYDTAMAAFWGLTQQLRAREERLRSANFYFDGMDWVVEIVLMPFDIEHEK